MSAVLNWRQQSELGLLYYDSEDEFRLHYPPVLNWGDFNKRSLGGTVTLIDLEVELNLQPNDFDYLHSAFPGFNFTPVSLEDIQSSLKLAMDVGEQNLAKVSLIHSLPFPTLRVNITLKSDDQDTIASELEERWNNQDLIAGELLFKASMLDVTCAYKVDLDFVSITDELLEIIGEAPVITSLVFLRVSEFVGAKVESICEPLGPDSSWPRRTELVEYLLSEIISSVFHHDVELFRYDSGERLVGMQLRDSRTLLQNKTTKLMSSNSVIDSIGFFDSK